MPVRSRLALCLDLAVCAATLALSTAFAPGPARPLPSSSGGAPSRASVVALVDALVVAAPLDAGGYDRALFPHWSEAAPGCDTRCAVLDRQRSPGGWWSAYDGYVARAPAELEIDHVVPLAEAWVSGAAGWGVGRRQRFANDLDGAELLAVSAWSNRAKGAADPARWRPPDPGWWCSYAAAWASVKVRWSLTADPAEVRALRDMADRC